MRHATERYTDDDTPELELVTLKLTQKKTGGGN
jgi:hypothetical protein